MIDLYSGTPGSGKSLRAAYVLIDWLKTGKSVVANFPIDEHYFDKRRQKKKPLGEFDYVDNNELSVAFLKAYAKLFHKPFREHQTLLIIDECASIFNSRSWDVKDRMEWIFFFQQHRKLGYDVILISQHDRMLDRQIRAFIETEYKHKAVKNFTLMGWLMSALCGGLFLCHSFWYGCHLKMGYSFFLLNRKKARIYDSYRLFD